MADSRSANAAARQAALARIQQNTAREEQRRNEAMNRYMELLRSEEEAKQARMQEEERAAKEKKYREDINWNTSALKGMQLGSVAGPWGALVGAGVGSAIGQAKAIRARMKGGQSFVGANMRTMMDTPFGINPGDYQMQAINSQRNRGRFKNRPDQKIRYNERETGPIWESVGMGGEDAMTAGAGTVGNIQASNARRQARTDAAQQRQEDQQLWLERVAALRGNTNRHQAPSEQEDDSFLRARDRRFGY